METGYLFFSPQITELQEGPDIKVRDGIPKQQEANGELKFITIENDGSKQNKEID